jgi:hypothetical protein
LQFLYFVINWLVCFWLRTGQKSEINSVDLFNFLAALWKLIRAEYLLNGEKPAAKPVPVEVVPVEEQKQPIEEPAEKQENTELLVVAIEPTNATDSNATEEGGKKSEKRKKKGTKKTKEKKDVAPDQKTLFLKVWFCLVSFRVSYFVEYRRRAISVCAKYLSLG